MNEQATRTLPEPLRDLFEGNVAYLRQHSVDPDLWKTHREGEKPNHYLDLDAFDSNWVAPGGVRGSSTR